MEKKLIKAILDVIKDVKDRPSVYGVWFEGHEHTSGVPHIYFTDGYVAVRLECGVFEGLRPINENMWVGGEQLQSIYKDMKTKDVCLNFHNDGTDGRTNMPEFWNKMVGELEQTDMVAINPEVFKKLAPFGSMLMTLKHRGGNKLVVFSGRGVNAIACPLVKKKEDELCEYQ